MFRLAAAGALTLIGLGVSCTPASAATATYNGGSLLTNVHVVLVAWGTNVPSAYLTKDKAMLADLSRSSGATNNFLSPLPEYSATGYKLSPGITYDGARVITPSRCTSTANPCDDTNDIQPELRAQISAGHLPAPRGATGLSTVYLVLMPQGMTVSYQGVDSGQAFCAVHDATTTNAGANLVYSLLPDDFSNGIGCGTEQAAADNETAFLTRELVDTITDPINSGGWGDFNQNDCPSCGELADICFYSAQAGATNTLNGHVYVVGQIWSNRENNCVASSNYHAPTASFTSRVSGKTVSFSATAAAHNANSISSYAWSFGDGRAGTGAHISHTYKTTRKYTVVLTATDSLGFVTRVKHVVTIG